MAEEDLQVTAHKLEDRLEQLIEAWADRESARGRLEAFTREDPPAPPSKQPIEDLLLMAQYIHDRRRYVRHLAGLTSVAVQADKDYDKAAENVREMVPGSVSVIYTYQAPQSLGQRARPDLQGNKYRIDIRVGGDTILVNPTE